MERPGVYPHHTESIQKVIEYFQQDPEVQALLLGGSIAHGFAGATSDVDVMFLISDTDYEKRLSTGQLTLFSRELCTYPEGYVDGKYIRPAFLKQVAELGSEPARFAFQDVQILFSRAESLAGLLQAAARYPFEGKTERLRRFYAQLEAWHWYTHEALKRNNHYLLSLAISKLVLFGGRLILTHNEMLYPYHKWFLQVLDRAPEKPAGLAEHIQRLYQAPNDEATTAFFELVKGFQPWPMPPTGWPNQFMFDSEINWLHGQTPVDDL